MNVQGKVIAITGAGAGIGAALARDLLQRDARVAAIDVRPERLTQLTSPTNIDALSTHVVDISDRDAVAALPAAITATHGQIDGLINCAGIIQPFTHVNDLDYDAIDRVMKINFYGTLYMTKAFLPHLLARDTAHIVNVCSMGGFLPVPGQSIYGASKAAVKLMSEGLYAELLDTSVAVSIAYPGATKTDITANSGVATPTSHSASQPSVPMLSAEAVAATIIDGIEANKLHIYTGRDAKSMNVLYRLAPTFATRFIAKRMKSLLD